MTPPQPVCPFKTSPCERSNVPVCTGTTHTCVSTCARCAGVHGDVLNVHTGTFFMDMRVFSACHTAHNTTHNITRRQRQRETEKEDREREREEKMKDKKNKTREDKTKEKRRQRKRERERREDEFHFFDFLIYFLFVFPFSFFDFI